MYYIDGYTYAETYSILLLLGFLWKTCLARVAKLPVDAHCADRLSSVPVDTGPEAHSVNMGHLLCIQSCYIEGLHVCDVLSARVNFIYLHHTTVHTTQCITSGSMYVKVMDLFDHSSITLHLCCDSICFCGVECELCR